MAREVTRRQLLGQAGTAAAGLAGLGVAGCSGSPASATSSGGSVVPGVPPVDGYQRFVTRPDLNPPVVTLARKVTGRQAHHMFINVPVSGPRRGGAVILDPYGELVWMGPDSPGRHKMDFDVQYLRGKPVLTWFEGKETHGWGEGVAVVADPSYRRLHTIHAHRGLNCDHHEFNITPEGHALVTCYKIHKNVDLRPVGGPRDGVIASGVCQEIDIATGKLLFHWDSLDHVPLWETYQPFKYKGKKFGIRSNPYDYFHINSLAPTADGHLLISSRNTWTIYKVNRKNGNIMWRMHGKRSDFTMGPGASYYWQHHVRPHPDNIMTVFDNGAAPPKEKQSRALVLEVDEKKMHVTLRHQYSHPGQVLLAAAMGSVQLLPDGRVFVGWGTNSFFSEFAADGKLLIAGATTKGNPSYRAFAHHWHGHPADLPAVAALRRSGGATIYVSWNGATEVASWTVLAGKTRSSLSPVASGRRSGFETAIAVRHSGPYFAVRAHDAKGRKLATSKVVAVS